MEQILINEYSAYISLLDEELTELSSIASNRGWQSTRVKAGEEGRDKIKKAIQIYKDTQLQRIKQLIDEARTYNDGWVFTEDELINSFIK